MNRIFTYLLIGALLFTGIAGYLPISPAIGAVCLAALALVFESWDALSKRFPESPEASSLLESVAICLAFGAVHLASQLGFMAGIPFLLRSSRLRDSAMRDSAALTLILLLSGWS